MWKLYIYMLVYVKRSQKTPRSNNNNKYYNNNNELKSAFKFFLFVFHLKNKDRDLKADLRQ